MIKFTFVVIYRKLKHLFSLYRFYLKTRYIPPLDCIIEGLDNIEIGEGFTMGIGAKLFSQGRSCIKIGNRVSLNYNVSINADGKGQIIIGNNTIIGPGSVFRASGHSYEELNTPIRDQEHVPGIIVLHENVWIGANVVILPNVTIGSNTIIGAGSVVTKSIDKNVIAAGVPAVIIKKR